ncbi:MAG: type II secretion system protein GspD [Lentisphaeria bacterium]|nr:type II secretion system protein GspD [Lentisphaeria bacterium]
MTPIARRTFYMFLALAALTGTSIYADETISGIDSTEVVEKTPESIEEGKRNVVSVAQQLREMFQPIRKQARQNVQEEPPYLKIIPSTNDTSILIYRCRYVTASKLRNSVDAMISDTGYVEYGVEQNMLTIRDSSENIEAIAKTLPLIDFATPQVLIEAKIVEVLLSDNTQRNLSFMFNSPTTISMIDGMDQRYDGDTMSYGGIRTSPQGGNTSDGSVTNWTFAAGHNNFNIALQWLLTALDAKVLSSPVIVVSRNEEAEISNGQDVPIQSQTITNGSISTSTTFKRVGVTLTVEPLMINNDNVTLRVEPEVSNIQSYQTIANGNGFYQVPVISIRSISSYLRLADGQIVIMGGLYTNRNSIQQERIPFLSDIPYLGELFTSKYTEKEILQLLFFLRVRILNPNDMADGVLFDPEEMIRTTNEFGEVMRNSDELPKLETTVEKVNEEFIENPLVSWKTLFGSDDEEKKAETKDGKSIIKSGEAAEGSEESAPESASGSASPVAVPADAQPGE